MAENLDEYARKLRRLCRILAEAGFLAQNKPTDKGLFASRVYGENTILVAEAVWAVAGVSWALGIATAPYVWQLFAWMGDRLHVPKLSAHWKPPTLASSAGAGRRACRQRPPQSPAPLTARRRYRRRWPAEQPQQPRRKGREQRLRQ